MSKETANKILKKELESNDDNTSDENEKYVVSYIECKRTKGQITKYKVHWASIKEHTWEPRENLIKYFEDILANIDRGKIYKSIDFRKACRAAPNCSINRVSNNAVNNTISGPFGGKLEEIISKYVRKGEYQNQSGFLELVMINNFYFHFHFNILNLILA